ncbi:prepilin peptidase [candidate division KSB1 bacterium]|nr:prepilin peptidase [candidate division KSB1 bacterium]
MITVALSNKILSILLIIIVIVAAYTDITRRKIHNILTLPAIVVGLALNVILPGQSGIWNSLLGFAVGFGIFLVMFLFGGMGGGDVKLMGAIGAFKGYPFILDAMLFSIFTGGILALLVMAFRGTLLKGLKNIAQSVFSFLIPHVQAEPLIKEDSHKIPFGFCIAVGTIVAVISDKVFQFHFFPG